MTHDIIQLIEKARRMSHSEWEELKQKFIKEAENSEAETRIYNLLKELGMQTNLIGYSYIKRAIMLCLENPKMVKGITKQLYPQIAEEFGEKWKNVERGMRHAIEVAYDRGDIERFQEVFQNTCNPQKGKPTNGEFIAGITEYIKRS